MYLIIILNLLISNSAREAFSRHYVLGEIKETAACYSKVHSNFNINDI